MENDETRTAFWAHSYRHIAPHNWLLDRVWGEYNDHGYAVYQFRMDMVPTGYQKSAYQFGYGELELFSSGNREHGLNPEAIAERCQLHAQTLAREQALPYEGIFHVKESLLWETRQCRRLGRTAWTGNPAELTLQL